MVGFDLGPLLQGQMRIAKLKSAYNSLIIGPRGFGALSLRWIQFASVLRCARSSFAIVMTGNTSFYYNVKGWVKAILFLILKRLEFIYYHCLQDWES